MDDRNQSPIFSRMSDFLIWLLDHTGKYPKSERFRMGKRIEDCAFRLYELLIEATRKPSCKRNLLLDADLELEKLRLYIRISTLRKLTSQSQYRHAANALVEVGKLLGGWIKTIPES